MRIQVVEDEDSVTINGVVFQRPFVEKPVSGEDHNIYGQFGASMQYVAVCVMVSLVSVYYPKNAGGGVKKLFRKTGDKSSEYVKVASRACCLLTCDRLALLLPQYAQAIVYQHRSLCQ